MTYDANEDSVESGTPFECYSFATPSGTFRYTTLPFSVTLDGNLYTSETIDRTTFETSAAIASVKTMDIMLPFDNELVGNYSTRTLPDYCTVTVYRAHYGDDLSSEFVVEWIGEAVGTEITEEYFVFKTKSLMASLLTGNAKSVKYQYPCNNRVYDARCQAVESSFRVSATVTRVNLNVITVNSDSNADGDLILGKITLPRTSEVRSIVNNEDVDSGGSEITIAYPFDDIVVGDSVTLTLGCDNRLTTCLNRFNNIRNFTGFPYIPSKNPFQGG